MSRITAIMGVILIVLGLGAYAYGLSTGAGSFTALIPAFFGVPILGLGLAASQWPGRRSLFIHIAVVLAVLGVIGAGRGLVSLPALFTRPDEVARPAAVIVQSVMAILCLAYIVMAVRSFIGARRKAPA